MRNVNETHVGWFRIEHRTDNALKVIEIESGEVMWLPLSQVDQIDEQPDGTYTIIMSKWIAQKKGLI